MAKVLHYTYNWLSWSKSFISPMLIFDISVVNIFGGL